MLVALAMCALACSDALSRITQPTRALSQDSSGIPAPETVAGCASFEVQLHGGSVVVVSEPDTDCGPLTPVLAGRATYNVANSVLQLPIALRNDGRLRLHAPSFLGVARDSVVVNGGGGSHVTLSVTPLEGGDVVRGDSVHLNYNATLPTSPHSSDKSAFLAPHDTSLARTLLVTLPKGATSVVLRVRATGTYVFTVPVDAPTRSADSTLIAARAKANILVRDPHFGYRVSRAWLWLSFTKSATKEDRQAAVDAVNGIVVGGMRLGSAHRYFVHVPVPTDSGGGPLARAIATLNKQAGVAHVDADYVDGPTAQYRRPADSAGVFTSWQLTPRTATGWNWAPEKDQAPLAWGCSTGSSSVWVAVVDDGLYHIFDLQGNYSADTMFATTLPSNTPHGTWVSSMLAAQGNNNTGIAGIMWQAHLGQYFLYDSIPGQPRNQWPFYAVAKAAAAGYKIINMSFTLVPDSATVGTGHPDSTDTNAVIVTATLTQAAIQSAPIGGQPVFVMAAGNYAVDAFYGGYAAAKYDTADSRRSR